MSADWRVAKARPEQRGVREGVKGTPSNEEIIPCSTNELENENFLIHFKISRSNFTEHKYVKRCVSK
jgi:hypothetical protein